MILISNMVAWSRQGPIPKAKYAKSEIHTLSCATIKGKSL